MKETIIVTVTTGSKRKGAHLAAVPSLALRTDTRMMQVMREEGKEVGGALRSHHNQLPLRYMTGE